MKKQITNIEDKKSFINIVIILNTLHENKNEFRERLVTTKPEKIKIVLTDKPQSNFLVEVEIKKTKHSIKSEWLHIDGIELERQYYKKTGVIEHPVFEITNLTDLYKKGEKYNEK